jgi:hypothetical protein
VNAHSPTPAQAPEVKQPPAGLPSFTVAPRQAGYVLTAILAAVGGGSGVNWLQTVQRHEADIAVLKSQMDDGRRQSANLRDEMRAGFAEIGRRLDQLMAPHGRAENK